MKRKWWLAGVVILATLPAVADAGELWSCKYKHPGPNPTETLTLAVNDANDSVLATTSNGPEVELVVVKNVDTLLVATAPVAMQGLPLAMVSLGLDKTTSVMSLTWTVPVNDSRWHTAGVGICVAVEQ